MESIGDKLKGHREQKGHSIEQIARDTNIAKRYLEALEAEDFSVFPGDPYLIGFLRNYADYLGIDPDEMVSLYKNFQIQSQPVPLDELLISNDRKPIVLIAIIVVVVIGLGVAGYFFVPKLLAILPRRDRSREVAVEDTESTGSAVYELRDEILERRFQEKDTITIPFKDSQYQIRLTDIRDDLTLSVPGGTNILRIGDERAIDLDGDAKMDIKVSLTDIDAGAKIKSAVLRFDRFVKTTVLPEEAPEADKPVVAVSSSEIGNASIASRMLEPVLIREAETEAPFRVNIIFRGYCLFRYYLDGKDRDERYFGTGDTIEMDVSKELRIWMSNAGNTIARVSGEEVDLGRPGEVATKMILWRADEGNGKKKLMLEAIY